MTDRIFNQKQEYILKKLDEIHAAGYIKKKQKEEDIAICDKKMKELEKKQKADEKDVKLLNHEIERYGNQIVDLKEALKNAVNEKKKRNEMLDEKTLEMVMNSFSLADLANQKKMKEKERDQYVAEFKHKLNSLELGPKEECPICCFAYTGPTIRYSIGCGHELCKACLDKIMDAKNECPTCGKMIKSDELRRHY